MTNLTHFAGCDFEFECPKKWDQFTATEAANVRHCDKCNKAVTLCADQDEFNRLADKGACVALHVREIAVGRLRVGIPRRTPQEIAAIETLYSEVPLDSKLH